MTPEEKQALEDLKGSALTPEQDEAISALLVDHENRNDVQISVLLSQGRTQLVTTPITMRGGAANFPAIGVLPGPLAFTAAVRKLRNFSHAGIADADQVKSLLAEAVGEQLDGFKALGLDFSSPALRSMLDLLVLNTVITVDEATGFKDLAKIPAPYHFNQISDALNRAQGRMTL